MSTATLESTAVDTLNDLLKSCLAASETYGVAINSIERRHDEASIALRVLQHDHAENAHVLQKAILALGGDPEHGPGASGFLSKAKEGVASLLGDESAIRALKDAEERCLANARSAAKDVDGSAREVLETMVIPRLAQHVTLLDGLITATA